MVKKRLISILGSIALVAGLLAGCGKSGSPDGGSVEREEDRLMDEVVVTMPATSEPESGLHLLFDSYGFEGGSFRGATRVAALDPKLWCELFWANRETLADLTDELIERLSEYSALLHGGDRAALLERLTISSDRKKKFDTLRGLDESQKPLFK